MGNAVRAHLEEVDRCPDLGGSGGPRERVLTSALQLHRRTDDGLRTALSAVGLRGGDLVDGYSLDAEPGGAEPLDRSAAETRRAERVAFVGRVLTDRRAAVEAVLAALRR